MGTNYGVINNFLSALGLEKVGWLTDGKIALGSMAIVTIWRWAGYYMVMVVAGRLEISQEFFEAADLDGANGTSTYLTGLTLYKTAFSSLKMGYSCTMAVFIFILSIIISVVQLKLTSDKD